MPTENFLLLLVVFCFSLIHLIEISSYLARFSGVASGSNAVAYTVQAAVFMGTRFFTMMLLPVLGLVVDMQVSKDLYLKYVSIALAGASLCSFFALFFRGYLIAGFRDVVISVKGKGSLFFSLLKMPFGLYKIKPVVLSLPSNIFRSPVFWVSSFIFAIYATSIFVAFYFGLIFSQYRTSISQLSAFTNAFATVLLTFYIEPKISVAIDNSDGALNEIFALILGRIFGVSFLSYIPVATLWFFSDLG